MSRAPFQFDPAASCDACGRHGAFPFDGENLCTDCYAGRGSCCSAEFSGAACKTKIEADSPTPTAGQLPPLEATDGMVSRISN